MTELFHYMARNHNYLSIDLLTFLQHSTESVPKQLSETLKYNKVLHK